MAGPVFTYYRLKNTARLWALDKELSRPVYIVIISIIRSSMP